MQTEHYHSILLEVCSNSSYERSSTGICQMASIFLRQDVQEHWEDINQTNKTFIMDNLIDKMCCSDNIQVIRDHEDVVYTIALHEYPHNWRTVLVKIGENLTKED